jgi:exonuclease SbcD
MKILHTSDWHLGKNLEQISRINEQHEFIDHLCNIVEEQKIDLVLIAGDIFDTYNPSAAAEELFYEAIERLNNKGKRAVIVIAGNHDNPERLCAASPLAYKSGIILLGYPGSDAGDFKVESQNIKIIQSGQGWFEISLFGFDYNAIIISLPYPSETRLEEVLSQQPDEAILQKAYSDKIGRIFSTLSQNFRLDTVNIIISHLFFLGGKESDSERTLQVGGALTVNPNILPVNAHFAAIGHLHRPQEIKYAPCPTFYSGSPLAYSFSEAEHSKAVYIIEAIPGEKALISPFYLNCGKPLRRWLAEEGINQAINWCEEKRDINAWIDLEIVTDRVLTIEEQKMLRTLHSGIINIIPRLKTEDVEILSSQNREGKKIDELFKDYYKYRMGTDITEDLLNTFLEILYEDDMENFL